jgi:aminoglycoside phosphotransferase (APT) family kinase protein
MMGSVLHTDDAFQQPIPALQIDSRELQDYLISNHRELFHLSDGQTVSVFQFSHGQSNPTYSIQIGGCNRRLVLRKQPPGPLLKGAHQVLREAKLLRYLSEHSAVPVPRVHVICEDPSILGTPFYIMEHVSGVIYTDPSLPSLIPSDRRAVYIAMAKVLASIHAVDTDGSRFKEASE